MQYVPLYALGSAVVAAFVTYLLVPPVIRLAVAWRALDEPSLRKRQANAMPRLGGVAIAGGIGIAAGFAALGQWRIWGNHIAPHDFVALAAGTLLVFLVGVVDDLRGVGTGIKFAVQLAAASLLVAAGWSFSVLRVPFAHPIDLGIVGGGIVSLLWIVGVTNAINLIDGLDGLAGGVVAIIALSMLGYAALQGSPGSVVLMAATAGACIGFLRHNWEPARIFMGDSGSLTLGFLLAAMSVHSALKAPAAVAIVVPILALGLPVMDTLLVMSMRFVRSPRARLLRRFASMFRADREHVHHLLEHFGARRMHVVGFLYAVVLSFCGMALLVAITGQPNLGAVLIVIEFGVVFGIRQLGRARRPPAPPAATEGLASVVSGVRDGRVMGVIGGSGSANAAASEPRPTRLEIPQPAAARRRSGRATAPMPVVHRP